MVNQNNSSEPTSISESEQMYLLTITRLVENGTKEPVPLASLAKALSIQPTSANQMVHSLQESGLLVYKPYKGVLLTTQGKIQAQRVLRYRNLWKRFLEDLLKITPQEAESLACNFEHVTTEYAAEKLQHFLEKIDLSGHFKVNSSKLTHMNVGDVLILVENRTEEVAKEFLVNQGFVPGSRIQIISKGTKGDLLVETPEGAVHISTEIADCLYVQALQDQLN